SRSCPGIETSISRTRAFAAGDARLQIARSRLQGPGAMISDSGHQPSCLGHPANRGRTASLATSGLVAIEARCRGTRSREGALQGPPAWLRTSGEEPRISAFMVSGPATEPSSVAAGEAGGRVRAMASGAPAPRHRYTFEEYLELEGIAGVRHEFYD